MRCATLGRAAIDTAPGRTGNQGSAKGRQIETEAAPIRYVAELAGANTGSERAIRGPIALMVLCCDPLAIAASVTAMRAATLDRKARTSPTNRSEEHTSE